MVSSKSSIANDFLTSKSTVPKITKDWVGFGMVDGVWSGWTIVDWGMVNWTETFGWQRALVMGLERGVKLN